MLAEAFKYQQKILEKYRLSNEISFKIIEQKTLEEKRIVYTSKVYGPYVEYITHHFSDGTVIDVTYPAPLNWVCLDLINYDR